MSKLRPRDKNALLAIQEKLGYPSVESLIFLTKRAPNSTVIHDSSKKLVWKVLWTREDDNPYLELEALERLPENKIVLKYESKGFLMVDGKKVQYLIFPFVSGKSLRDEINDKKRQRSTPFSYQEIKNVAKKIVEGISLLHKNNIIHQDIKPANIMLEDDKVTLIDLGIARFLEENFKKYKTIKAPYAYMSPEKLNLVANGDFIKRLSVTFSSDLFSLGLVLLEMATLKVATKDMELKIGQLSSIETLLDKMEIEEKSRELIRPFLKASPFERQEKVADILEVEWFKKKKPSTTRFWYHSGWNTTNFYDKLFSSDNALPENFGYIYPAEIVRKKEYAPDILSSIKTIHEKGGVFAFDPCTYLQLLQKEHHRGLKHLSYKTEISIADITNPSFLTKDFAKNYARQVIKEQIDLKSDIIISPYFYLKKLHHDNVEANFLIWLESSKIIESLSTSTPLYHGLIVSEDLIKDWNELSTLALIILNQPNVENIYLRLESSRPDSQPITDEEYLRNTRKFINLISKSKNILLAPCSIEGLGLMMDGVSEISTHFEFSKRKFYMKNKESGGGGGGTILRFFVRVLLNEIQFHQEFESINEILEENKNGSSKMDDLVQCNCPYCPNRDQDSIHKHFLHHMVNMFEELAGLSLDERKVLFNEWLDDAKLMYGILANESDMELHNSSSGGFSTIWKVVFSE